MKSDITSLSFSKISTLQRCGHLFELRYLRGRFISNPHLIRGIAVAKTVEADLSKKVDTGDLLRADEIADLARDTVQIEWDEKEHVRLDAEQKGLGVKRVQAKTKDLAVKFAGLHHRRVAPHVKPKLVEEWWETTLPGMDIPLRGRYDFITEDDVIEDTKSTLKSPPTTAAHESEQLTLYDIAFISRFKRRPKGARLRHLVVTPTGREKVVLQETTRTDTERNGVIRRVFQARDQIRKAVFPPANPSTDWWCSAKCCEFYKNGCDYVR